MRECVRKFVPRRNATYLWLDEMRIVVATASDENPILAAVNNLFLLITNSANRAAALH